MKSYLYSLHNTKTISNLDLLNLFLLEMQNSVAHIPKIEYDGLRCPSCGEPTVKSGHFNWCPIIDCDYGNEFTQPQLYTKILLHPHGNIKQRNNEN